jgi:hypothetical protein
MNYFNSLCTSINIIMAFYLIYKVRENKDYVKCYDKAFNDLQDQVNKLRREVANYEIDFVGYSNRLNYLLAAYKKVNDILCEKCTQKNIDFPPFRDYKND